METKGEKPNTKNTVNQRGLGNIMGPFVDRNTNIIKKKKIFTCRQSNYFEHMAYFFKLQEAVKHISLEEPAAENCLMLVFHICSQTLNSKS